MWLPWVNVQFIVAVRMFGPDLLFSRGEINVSLLKSVGMLSLKILLGNHVVMI